MSERQFADKDAPLCWNDRDGCLGNCEDVCMIANPAPSAEDGLRKRLRPFLPNRSDALALVSLNDQRPFRAYWPLTLVQIVGGRTWSISFVRYRTREPRVTSPEASDR